MDDVILIEFGKRVKALMELKNIKRSYVAEKIGITYNTLTKKLNGQREFTLLEIIKMKDVLNIDLKQYNSLLFNEKFYL